MPTDRSKSKGWGPVQDSSKYRLLMAREFFPSVVALDCGYSVGQPEYDETTALQVTRWCFTRSGKTIPITETIKVAQTRQINIDIGLPPSYTLWTPLHVVAGSDCKRDFFMCYKCPPQSKDAHFFHMVDATMDQIKPGTVYIEGSGDQVAYTASSRIHVPRIDTNYGLLGRKQQDITAALHAIAFDFGNCKTCNPNEHRNGYYGGIGGLYHSTDNFVNGTALTLPGFAVTDRVSGIYAEGGIVLVTAEIGISPGPSTGAIYYSEDDGATFQDVSPALAPVLEDVIEGGGYYYACGVGAVYRSLDGLTWETITNTVAPAPAVLYKMAYDELTNTVYIAGDDAGTGIALALQGTALTDITTTVMPTGTVPLYSVAVLYPGHVAFGGNTGYFTENADVSQGEDFTVKTIGTGAIRAIQGGRWNTVIGDGNKLYTRNVCNGMTWKALGLTLGLTIVGNILGGADGNYENGVNDMAFVTASGEILRVAPQHPGALV